MAWKCLSDIFGTDGNQWMYANIMSLIIFHNHSQKLTSRRTQHNIEGCLRVSGILLSINIFNLSLANKLRVFFQQEFVTIFKRIRILYFFNSGQLDIGSTLHYFFCNLSLAIDKIDFEVESDLVGIFVDDGIAVFVLTCLFKDLSDLITTKIEPWLSL